MKQYRMRQFRPKACKPPAHAHPLVKELYAHMREERIGVCDVTERAGVSRSVVAGWGKRQSPLVETLEACGGVLGLRLAWVPDTRGNSTG